MTEKEVLDAKAKGVDMDHDPDESVIDTSAMSEGKRAALEVAESGRDT